MDETKVGNEVTKENHRDKRSIRNIQRSKYSGEFKMIFGVPLEAFASALTFALGRFYFDVVKFNDHMVRREGYEDSGKRSLKAFLTKKYGKAASKLVELIIKELREDVSC